MLTNVDGQTPQLACPTTSLVEPKLISHPTVCIGAIFESHMKLILSNFDGLAFCTCSMTATEVTRKKLTQRKAVLRCCCCLGFFWLLMLIC